MHVHAPDPLRRLQVAAVGHAQRIQGLQDTQGHVGIGDDLEQRGDQVHACLDRRRVARVGCRPRQAGQGARDQELFAIRLAAGHLAELGPQELDERSAGRTAGKGLQGGI